MDLVGSSRQIHDSPAEPPGFIIQHQLTSVQLRYNVVKYFSIPEDNDYMEETRSAEDCIASMVMGQSGHFTRKQALDCGMSDALIAYHVNTGRFIREHTGVYRLKHFPSDLHDHVVAAWLAVGADTAVVSHETALDLAELSDVIPNWIHLTVPRGKRVRKTVPGLKIHTTTRSLEPPDVVTRDGMRVTSVARTIVDSAEAGTGPEQIEMAVAQAVSRAMTTPKRLREAARDRNRYVRTLIERSLERVSQ